MSDLTGPSKMNRLEQALLSIILGLKPERYIPKVDFHLAECNVSVTEQDGRWGLKIGECRLPIDFVALGGETSGKGVSWAID
jgi:hypothetical protein